MRQYQTKIKRTILHIQNKYIVSKITFYTKKKQFYNYLAYRARSRYKQLKR